MNTSLTAYTHLESLLLFQSLHAYGVGPPVFSRISELLKKNPHIIADKRFQSGRLSPDALRNFYLHILKEEIRSERQEAASDPGTPNGEVKSSRKRKAPSPTLPTTQEAAQHAHLIPKLVTKLYARYRAAITADIRDEEDRYERLQREIQGVERGEWDQQLQERHVKNTGSRSPSLPRKSPLLPQKAFPPIESPRPVKQEGLAGGFAPGNGQGPDGFRRPEEVVDDHQKPMIIPEGQPQVGDGGMIGANVPPLSSSPAQMGQGVKNNQDAHSLPSPNGQTIIEQDPGIAPNNTPRPSSDLQASADLHVASTTRTFSQDQILKDTSSEQGIYPLPSLNGNGQANTGQDSRVPVLPSGQIEAAPKKAPRKKKAPTDSRTTPAASQPLTGPTPSPQPNRIPLQPLPLPSAFPPSQPASVGYNASSPHIHRSPYPPQGAPSQGQISQAMPPSVPQPLHLAHSPTGPPSPYQNMPHMALSGSSHASNQSYSPHPQPPAVGAPPHVSQLPLQQIQPYGGSGAPQFHSPPGAHPQYSPTNQGYGGPFPQGPQSPAVQTPVQQRMYHPYPGQSPYPQQHPQASQPLPQGGGVMLPPFQVSPQDPSRAHQQFPMPHHSQLSTPVNIRQLPPSASSSRPGIPPMHVLVTQHRNSFSTPSNLRTPQSAGLTPRSVRSLWKSSAQNSPVVPRPIADPIDDIAPVATPKQSQSKPKTARKPRAKARAKEQEPEKEAETEDAEKEAEKEIEPDAVPEQSEEPVPEIETRQGRSLRKAPAKRKRLGSKASSHAAGSTRDRSRSPSILSHTDTVTADTESQAGFQVKSEPGLANDVIDEDSAATPSGPSTRRRGAQSLKRKRNVREASVADSEEPPAILESQTIIAPKGFARMCNPIMNEINSHKHSSIFTSAVKAKDAEGYYDIIKRPTDLKSIQKAINAGNKIMQAAATDTPAGSPGGGGGVVELPLSLETIPPKAIVNSAQLEKELMRMFVNAVMFNAGEEGIVDDARQMFETVQQSVSKWRSIKQSSGARLEVEETPPIEEEAPTTAKRRKL